MLKSISKLGIIFGVICLTSLTTFASVLTPTETAFAFQGNANIQTLSPGEMASIEGEWLFLVPVIFSAVKYTATSYAAGSFAWGGLAWAAGSGLLGGGVYGSVGRAAGYAPWLFNGIGFGIGSGLNYANPWKYR